MYAGVARVVAAISGRSSGRVIAGEPEGPDGGARAPSGGPPDDRPSNDRPSNDGIRARLFDADGHDRTIALTDRALADVGERRLLWVDVDLDAGGSLEALTAALQLDERDLRRIERETTRSRLTQGSGRLHLTLHALEPEDPDDASAPLVRREIDMLAAPNLLVTVHRGRVEALQRYIDGLSGETSIGVLGAGDVLYSLVDEVITGYFLLSDRIERQIERLDQAALAGRRDVDVLAELVTIRRTVGLVRRVLVPHRSALAALARPGMRAEEAVAEPWPGLMERLEGAIGSIEALRDALLGTYDIHMGREAQRANEVMKALTILSAVLLPAVVLAGLMGMNFGLPFFDEPDNFYVVVGVMALFGVLLIGFARWRHWL